MTKIYNDVLIINSYAGSLTIAASQEKLNILASMEDKGYGLGSQRANFPDVPYVESLPWPEPGTTDLRDVISIAHPPCACFSVQGAASKNPKLRGLDSEHFKSSKHAIEYALERQVAALAVESVMGTLEGARPYHDRVAKKYGYHIYRILQNAITFGLPQWRQRFWCVFVRHDVAPSKFVCHHRPFYQTVSEALRGVKPGEDNVHVKGYFEKLRKSCQAPGLLSKRDWENVVNGEGGYGPLPRVIGKYLGLDRTQDDCYSISKKYGIMTFSSSWPMVVDPGGFVNTIMCSSHLWYEGRPLTVPEYNVLAGFPAAYKFDLPREQQCYLSRGVAPPVARWILQTVKLNLEGRTHLFKNVQVGYDKIALLAPGETADLRVKRGELKQLKLFNLNQGD